MTKREFFKTLAGGSAAAAIATGAASGSTPEVSEAMHQALGGKPGKDPLANPNLYGYRADRMDVVPWILYSRFYGRDFHQGSSRIRPFMNCLGHMRWGAADLCTRLDTNLYLPGELPAPEVMVIGGIMILLDRDTSDDNAALFEKSVSTRLQLGMKIYQDVPASRMTARADLDSLVRRNGEPTEFVTAKMYRCDPPHVILSRMAFDFELDAGLESIPPEIAGYILLDGMLARGVQ